MPVVPTSRVGVGSILAHTYEFANAKKDLRNCSLIDAGFLNHSKNSTYQCMHYLPRMQAPPPSGPLSPTQEEKRILKNILDQAFPTPSNQHVRNSELTLERTFDVVCDHSEDSHAVLTQILPKRKCPPDLH